MRRVADLLTAGRSGVDLELVVEVQLVDQVSEDAFGHGAAADVAVADKEHFYHRCITSHFLVFLDISGFVSLCEFLLSGITWFIFA